VKLFCPGLELERLMGWRLEVGGFISPPSEPAGFSQLWFGHWSLPHYCS